MTEYEDTLGILGPDGTISAEAGLEYCKREGIHPEIVWYETIKKCFDGVQNEEVKNAIVPLVNSTSEASWVNETLTGLRDNGTKIYGELIHPITHNLAALPNVRLSDIAYIMSKDKAIEQCGKYLAALPGISQAIELHSKDSSNPYPYAYKSSTAAAANELSTLRKTDAAAICTLRAAELYGLNVLAQGIQDNKNNKTKFIAIGNEDHTPTGKDDTALMLEFENVAKPGLLYEVLGELAKRNISLGYIQSIPKEGSLDELTFYITFHGHKKDAAPREALKAIADNPDLSLCKILGSYPRSS